MNETIMPTNERALPAAVMTDRAIPASEGAVRVDNPSQALTFNSEPPNRRGRRHIEASMRSIRRSTHRTMLRERHN